MYRPVSIIISNGIFRFAILSYNMSKKMFSATQQVGYIEIALFLTKQLHVSALKTKLS